MIINIDWQDFQMRFLRKAEMVFVVETTESWTLYTNIGDMCIKTFVMKKEEDEQNIMFVDRYLNEPNICKARSVNEQMKISMELIPNVL